ncbi:MAG TPA: folate family ECF transporter S component [Candidatus Merdivicinus excrementipullorum]|uniref:Folate family ECF transporter S component n=1 Tax=Candidatus Merdivicinus excrementipullorum TaxID=2840867 RepID=A0A9D1FNC8_9FIRM|nr:folate family ECF transporter S component [Candidatus Merdivicinus excrementipullorum]
MQKTENPSNLRTFRTPFTPSYWKEAAGEVKKPRVLAVTALFIGLDIIIGMFYIPMPFGDNLRVYFGYFTNSMCCMVCGPVMALIFGFVRDILGFLANPSGGFFFGYTLSAMLGSFVYALFFYRARITIARILCCKLIINVCVNILLGSLWSAVLFSKGYYFYMASSTVKNLMLLPVEVILLVLFYQVTLPILVKMKWIPEQPKGRMPLI